MKKDVMLSCRVWAPRDRACGICERCSHSRLKLGLVCSTQTRYRGLGFLLRSNGSSRSSVGRALIDEDLIAFISIHGSRYRLLGLGC
jgi:hypothetical protein